MQSAEGGAAEGRRRQRHRASVWGKPVYALINAESERFAIKRKSINFFHKQKIFFYCIVVENCLFLQDENKLMLSAITL